MEEGEAALRSGRGPLVSANEDSAGIAEFPSMTMKAVVVGVAGAGGQLGVVGPDPDLMAVLTRSGCPVRVVPGGLLAANLAEVCDVADIFSSNGSIISNISHQLVYDGIFFATVSFPTDCFFLLKYFRKTIHLLHRKICHLCCHWCFIVRMFDRFVICYGFCCVVDEPTL